MLVPHRRLSHMLSVTLSLALLLACGAAAHATAGEMDVYVPVGSLAEVDRLSEAGFIVRNRSELLVVLSVTPDEAERLRAMGHVFWPVPEAPVEAPDADKSDIAYYTYTTMTADLERFAAEHPDICRLYSLGQSVQGLEIWALLITSDPDVREPKPAFKYVATMHGDEPVGTDLCMYLSELLLTGYGEDERLTRLVDETEIWIVPLMNPDGHLLNRRANFNFVDLNRDFPRFGTDFTGTLFDGTPLGAAGRQPETQHVMRWTADHRFVLSANLHTGALVVNYPYDDNGFPSGVYAATPDAELVRHLALTYADANPPMSASPVFHNGITNGGQWYVIQGGMQDWNYRYAGCIEVTLELSSVKRPAASLLPQFWEDNRESMLRYMEAVHMGARGFVTDRVTGAPLEAQVHAGDNPQPVGSHPEDGDYYRLLLPGEYDLHFSAPGYFTFTVHDVTVTEDAPARVDVTLSNGDINGDGAVNVVDLQLVINAALGIEVPYDTDIDGGGTRATDIQKMVNRVLAAD